MHPLQLLFDDSQITLSCGKPFVAEHFLDMAQVGSIAEHFGGKSVAKDMPCNSLSDPSLLLVDP